MSTLKTIVPKPERAQSTLLARPRKKAGEDARQRQLMVGSLCLLLLALGIVLWHDRDFWFPDSQDTDADTEQPAESSPAARNTSAVEPAAAVKAPARAVRKSIHAAAKTEAASSASVATPTPPAATTTRTVLPPLEVEVVAGDNHRTIRPGSNSLHVDLQPGAPAQPATDRETAADVTSNAAERVQMSSDASAIVTSTVKPNYPLLARQMKVQGSVILQALIGRDGIIQNLRVVSGPHILASAAQDAVRQWHFKPHLEGSEPVETQAKITVNFTISTN